MLLPTATHPPTFRSDWYHKSFELQALDPLTTGGYEGDTAASSWQWRVSVVARNLVVRRESISIELLLIMILITSIDLLLS